MKQEGENGIKIITKNLKGKNVDLKIKQKNFL